MNENVPILLVEDNPDNVMITRMAFEKGNIKNTLYVARDGDDALRFLFKEGEYVNVPTPGLILLDLNLPKVSGYEVLRKIKMDERLKRIPVIILTVSTNDSDIRKTYELGANSYIAKPAEFKDFVNVVSSLTDYWLRISRIPGG
ncbi:MAG: response regulator [Methanobacteriota archaeon]